MKAFAVLVVLTALASCSLSASHKNVRTYPTAKQDCVTITKCTGNYAGNVHYIKKITPVVVKPTGPCDVTPLEEQLKKMIEIILVLKKALSDRCVAIRSTTVTVTTIKTTFSSAGSICADMAYYIRQVNNVTTTITRTTIIEKITECTKKHEEIVKELVGDKVPPVTEKIDECIKEVIPPPVTPPTPVDPPPTPEKVKECVKKIENITELCYQSCPTTTPVVIGGCVEILVKEELKKEEITGCVVAGIIDDHGCIGPVGIYKPIVVVNKQDPAVCTQKPKKEVLCNCVGGLLQELLSGVGALVDAILAGLGIDLGISLDDLLGHLGVVVQNLLCKLLGLFCPRRW